jgi:hypothetical protein
MMPIYHLNIRENTEVMKDVEGQEYPSLAAAHADAVEGAREIMAERILAGKPLDERGMVEITDNSGSVIERVAFADALLSSK